MNINFNTATTAEQEVVSAQHSGDSIFSTIIEWVLLLGALLVPLFFLPWTSDVLEFQKQTLLIILAGVGLVAWLVGIIKEGKISFVSSKLTLPIVVLLLTVFLSASFSLERFKSFFGAGAGVTSSFATFIALGIYFFLMLSTVKDQGAKIIKYFTLSATIALLFGVLQILGLFVLPFGFLKSKAFTTLGSLNAMGVFAAAILPLFMTKLGNEKSLWKWAKYIGIALTLFILIFVNWWVVWAIAIVGMLSFVAFRSFTGGFNPSKFILPMTVIVIGVFLIVTGLNFTFLKDSSMPTEVSPSYGLSFDIAKDTLIEKPVSGYGPENFMFAYEKYGSSALAGTSLSDVRFTDSASEFFSFVVQNGFVGLASLAFLLFSIVMLVVKSLKGDRPSITPTIGASLMALLLVFFIYPMTMTLMFSLWFVLALFVIRVEGEDRRVNAVIENSPRYSLISSVAFILGLIMILSGGYYITVRNIADMKYVSAANEENLEAALQKGVDAININPSDSRYYRVTSNILLTQIRDEVKNPAGEGDTADQTTKIQNLVQAVFEVAKRATDTNPHDSANWSQRGFVYQTLVGFVGGTEDLAIENYKEALKRNPSSATLLNRMGETYLLMADVKQTKAQSNVSQKTELNASAEEDIQSAQDYFKKASDLNKNFGIALYNLGKTYERQGKLKEAISQLEVLAPYNSNDAGLALELGLLYYRDGRKDAAYQQLQRAVKILPNYANALWYLSLINEERGNIEGAIANLEVINKESPDNQIVIQKIEELKNGKSTLDKSGAINQEPLQIPSAE